MHPASSYGSEPRSQNNNLNWYQFDRKLNRLGTDIKAHLCTRASELVTLDKTAQDKLNLMREYSRLGIETLSQQARDLDSANGHEFEGWVSMYLESLTVELTTQNAPFERKMLRIATGQEKYVPLAKLSSQEIDAAFLEEDS